MPVCEKCGKYFSKIYNLFRHRKTSCHQQQIQKCYECYECNRKFTRKDILARHITCRHMFENESFECFHCSKKFTLKHSLVQHVVRLHMSEKKKKPVDKVCKTCGKKFASVEIMKRHHKTVHRKSIQQGRNSLCVEEAPFECNDCKKKFKRRDSLTRHIKYHILGKKSFVCAQCSRKYSVSYSLSLHMRLCHSQNITNCNKEIVHHSQVKEFKCLVCNRTFVTADLIHEHYEKDHLIIYVYEYFEFTSRAEFGNWMNNERNMYIQCRMRNHWETETYVAKVFRCHRSGERCEKTAPKRIRKFGSKKLNGFCPMYINLKESKIDGKCSVKYQKTHVGHSCEENELPYLRLKEKEMSDTDSKISLPQNESSTLQGSCSRLSGLSCDDTTHSTSKCGLDKRCPSAVNDDSLNIHNFVSENRDSVLFYKVQGEHDERFPTLAKDDFALGYMNNDQESALMRYGNKIVAFSGTHSTNPNNFILHSMSIQDVDFEGYPVVFLLSNRNDKAVITVLLQNIKQRVGIVKPKAIMSDMQHFYFNAWTEEMGPVTNRLYCTWNVHEAWKRNYSKINNKELRQAVKKEVENLSREPDKKLFEEKLNNLMRNNDVESLNFLKYFCRYVSTKEYWAYCYRNHVGYSTNMGVERFHKTFKEKTAGGIKIESVYECLCLLQTYLKWKEKDIETKSMCGKICHKTRALRKRHRAAEKKCTLKEKFIKRVTRTCWQIQSFPDTDDDALKQESYTVQKLDVKECARYSDIVCSLLCTECKICHHDFICNCPDSTIRNYMCEHIHTLGMYLLNQEFSEDKLTHEEVLNQEEMTRAEDDFNREEKAHVEEDFDFGDMVYLGEDFYREEMILVDEDLNQEEVIYIDEDFNLTDPAEEAVQLESYRDKIIRKCQEDLQDAHTHEALQEIYNTFIAPIKPTLKAINEHEKQLGTVKSYKVQDALPTSQLK